MSLCLFHHLLGAAEHVHCHLVERDAEMAEAENDRLKAERAFFSKRVLNWRNTTASSQRRPLALVLRA